MQVWFVSFVFWEGLEWGGRKDTRINEGGMTEGKSFALGGGGRTAVDPGISSYGVR